MIKAVLWDFGGVFTSSPFEAFNRYEQDNKLPADFIRTVNATNPDSNAWAQFESSQIDPGEFNELFAEETANAGHRIPGSDVLNLLSGDVRPAMVQALARIKTRYNVACITNNVKGVGAGPGMASDPDSSRALQKAEQVAGIMARFDFVIESSLVGLRKPDPRIYQMACDKLAVQPNEAVFLDDLGINLKPARAMGMSTIKVLSVEQTLADLSTILAMDLTDY